MCFNMRYYDRPERRESRSDMLARQIASLPLDWWDGLLDDIDFVFRNIG